MTVKIKRDIGPQALSGADSAEINARAGKTGEGIIQQLHGRYYEQSSRSNIYSSANSAAQAVSAALATAYTGIGLYNPVGSGVLLVPLKVKFALSVAPAAIATIGLITAFASTGAVTTATTALIVRSQLIGNSSPGRGLTYSSATITTPVWLMQLVDGFTAAALPAPSPVVDLEGSVAILPGGFVGIGALTAVTGLGSISWEEVPYP
jgi:hypothetical protein